MTRKNFSKHIFHSHPMSLLPENIRVHNASHFSSLGNVRWVVIDESKVSPFREMLFKLTFWPLA